jgi:hypothetical protein
LLIVLFLLLIRIAPLKLRRGVAGVNENVRAHASTSPKRA